MEKRDYELIGEDVPAVDPQTYGVITDEEAGDEPTEFGVKPGEIPEEENDGD